MVVMHSGTVLVTGSRIFQPEPGLIDLTVGRGIIPCDRYYQLRFSMIVSSSKLPMNFSGNLHIPPTGIRTLELWFDH